MHGAVHVGWRPPIMGRGRCPSAYAVAVAAAAGWQQGAGGSPSLLPGAQPGACADLHHLLILQVQAARGAHAVMGVTSGEGLTSGGSCCQAKLPRCHVWVDRTGKVPPSTTSYYPGSVIKFSSVLGQTKTWCTPACHSGAGHQAAGASANRPQVPLPTDPRCLCQQTPGASAQAQVCGSGPGPFPPSQPPSPYARATEGLGVTPPTHPIRRKAHC